MRASVGLSALVLFFTVVTSRAQDKIAQGDYVLGERTISHWTLTATAAGYHLESKMQNLPAAMSLSQIEELDEQFVPLVVGFELTRNNSKTPDITARCEISPAITCTGASGSEPAPTCQPFKVSGPFWLYVEGLTSMDLPWLLGGAVNMTHQDQAATSVNVVNILGGSAVMIGDAINIASLKETLRAGQKLNIVAPEKPVAWRLSVSEKSKLQYIGPEAIQIQGTAVAVRHYTLGEGKNTKNIWAADPGIIVRIDKLYLANYRQSKKLIPELPVQ